MVLQQCLGPSREKIISRAGGCHGISVATAILTNILVNQTGFNLPNKRILHTACLYYYQNAQDNELKQDYATRLANELEQLILTEGADTIAAFIAEPVIAAGGATTRPETYFAKIQAVLNSTMYYFYVTKWFVDLVVLANCFGAETLISRPVP